MIVAFLVASGWMSIRFSSITKELKKHYYIYIYILVTANSDICSSFYIKNTYLTPYDFMSLLFMLYIIYIANKSYNTVLRNNNKQLFVSFQEEYTKCLTIKKYRFNMIYYLTIGYSLYYISMKTIVDILKLNAYWSSLRFIFEDIIIILLLVLYKPSNILLKNHINPGARISKSVSNIL